MFKLLSNVFDKRKSGGAASKSPVGSFSCSEPFLVLFAADYHGTLAKSGDIELPPSEADLVVSLGDNYVEDLLVLQSYARRRGAPLCGVLGNHDEIGQLEKCRVVDIEKEPLLFRGVTFVGLNGSLRYKETDAPLVTDEESEETASRLLESDVFVTHDGPKRKTDDFAHSGLSGISKYIKEKRPPYHFYGHRHVPGSVFFKGTRSTCLYRLSLWEFSLAGACEKWSSEKALL